MKHLAKASVLLIAFSAGPARAQQDADPEPPAKKLLVALKTNHGTIEIELFDKKAPVTVKNFLAYVDEKFYDGLVFHRVIENFMIQGGGYEKGAAAAQNLTALEKKGKAAIKCESDNGLSNERGTIAMARTQVANSATSQFYINVKDNAFLDRARATDKVGYCVFGKVVKGMDVVDKIKQVKTKSVGAFNDVPTQDVVLESVRRVRR